MDQQQNFKLLIDKILPFNGDINIKEPLNYGKRILPDKYWYSLFSENGQLLKSKSDQVEGISSAHDIPFIIDEENNKLLFKFQPKFPMMELITNKFVENLFKNIGGSDGALSNSYYAIINGSNEKNNQNYPVLISEEVKGELLYDVIQSGDKANKLNNLDPKSISKLLVSTMLVNPIAHNYFRDYIVSPMKITGNETITTPRYQLISINNENTFLPGSRKILKSGLFSATEYSLNVNTVLYATDQMHDLVHQDVINELANSFDPFSFLKEWLLIVSETQYKSSELLYCSHMVNHVCTHKDEKTKTRICFPDGSITLLLSKLCRLQDVMKKQQANPKRQLTHWKLLQILEPSIAIDYEWNRVFSKIPVFDKYQKIVKAKEIAPNYSLPTCSSYVKKSRGITKKNKQHTGLLEFERLVLEIANLNNNDQSIVISNLKLITSDYHVEKYCNLNIDHKQLQKNQSSIVVSDFIERKDIRYLSIKNCSSFTFKTLNSSQSINVIKKMEFNCCSSLKNIGCNGEYIVLPALTHMEINGCSNFKILNISAHELVSLKINECPSLNDFTIYSIHLRKLVITSSTINKVTMGYISGRENLQSFDISNSKLIGGLSTIEFGNLKDMVQLNLKNVINLEKVVFSFTLPLLATLNFNDSKLLKEIKTTTNGLLPLLESFDINGTLISNNQDSLFKCLKSNCN